MRMIIFSSLCLHREPIIIESGKSPPVAHSAAVEYSPADIIILHVSVTAISGGQLAHRHLAQATIKLESTTPALAVISSCSNCIFKQMSQSYIIGVEFNSITLVIS